MVDTRFVLWAPLALVAVLATGLAAGCSSGPQPGTFTELSTLAARRVQLSDAVAASKFGTRTAIDDPARERQVVAAATAAARRSGIDEQWVGRVVADQIEASKVVQRGLFRLWTDRPDLRPRTRPNLASVRPELDRIGDGLVEQLRRTAQDHTDGGCPAALSSDSAAVASGLDALHRDALAVALRSVCSG